MIDLTKKYRCKNQDYQLIAGPFYCSEIKADPIICAIKKSNGDVAWFQYSENGWHPNWNVELIAVDLEVDQQILVSDNNKDWYHRHFAKFDSDGSVKTFPGGITSWSCADSACPENRHKWKYWKLPVVDVVVNTQHPPNECWMVLKNGEVKLSGINNGN